MRERERFVRNQKQRTDRGREREREREKRGEGSWVRCMELDMQMPCLFRSDR